MKKNVLFSLLFSVLMAFLVENSLLYENSWQWNDKLYQDTSPTKGNIFVLGIDEKSIEELGVFPWTREVFAELFQKLNSNPEAKPLVIGVDVLFTGASSEGADKALIEAVEQAGNIILACSYNYRSELFYDDIAEMDSFYYENSWAESMNLPFSPLNEIANLGHINSMLDRDGILRHGFLYINGENGEKIPSFHLALFQKYCEFYGITDYQLPNTGENYSWYLPFTADTGGYYDFYGVSDVLTGRLDPSIFQDSIVLIGPYTQGLQDQYVTAIDHNSLMYGVEYQANALEALMKQEFLTEVSVNVQRLVVFLLTFTITLLLLTKKNFFGFVVCVSVALGWLGFCVFSYSKGYLWHSFYVPLMSSLLFLLILCKNSIAVYLEKVRVTSTFKKYLAPDIVDGILKQGTDSLELGGIVKDICVLFIDVRNFTSLSEKLPPQKVLEILNYFLEIIAKTIMNNGGTLDKFIGDSAMAFWGAPLPQEDYEYKAVKTALALVEELEPASKIIFEEYGHEIFFGIGLHCGEAIVGNIGSQERMDFTVIGDTVNTASRLESQAKGNQIYASEVLYQRLKDKVEFTPLAEPIPLKGKEKPMNIYVVNQKQSKNL